MEKLWLCCDIRPRCTFTFSPAQNSNQDFQVFSALDVLDYILQLLFGIHVEGLPGLYCCKLKRRHGLRRVAWNLGISTLAVLCKLKTTVLKCFFQTKVKIKLLMWFALDIYNDAKPTLKCHRAPCCTKIKYSETG